MSNFSENIKCERVTAFFEGSTSSLKIFEFQKVLRVVKKSQKNLNASQSMFQDSRKKFK